MSVYQNVLSSIVAAIERGADSFEMPWHSTGSPFSIPVNVTTSAPYRGLNILVLWGAAHVRNFSSARWATYKQWASIGAQVRAGERGTACIKWKDIPTADASVNAERRLLPLGFTLFNADQVDGFEPEIEGSRVSSIEAHAAADAVISAAGVPVIHAGQAAYYRPSTDQIVLPDRWRFRDTDAGTATTAYYAVALHELVHATQTPDRCNRDFAKSYGQDLEARALEELVAELGAAFCCARLGIVNEPRPDHAEYIQSWLKALKKNPNALTRTASLAQSATDWLLNRLPAPGAEPTSFAEVA